MRNSLACLHTWFAANRLGAVWVPINTEFRGLTLAHVCALARARLFVADADLRDPLVTAIAGEGARVLVHGEGPDPLAGLYAERPVEPVEVAFSDQAAFLFTSGTTGRSKACVLSHRYFLTQATILLRDFELRHDDVLYCPFPLFHADATALTTVPALLLGATAAIGRRFSTRTIPLAWPGASRSRSGSRSSSSASACGSSSSTAPWRRRFRSRRI
jgi:crotonobetaine/carnitine-CoA ligase